MNQNPAGNSTLTIAPGRVPDGLLMIWTTSEFGCWKRILSQHALHHGLLEHRINTLAGYTLLLHENNMIYHRNRKARKGLPDFRPVFSLYTFSQICFIVWASYDRNLLSLTDGESLNEDQFSAVILLLIVVASLPLIYWTYVEILYCRKRRQFAEDCLYSRSPLGELTADHIPQQHQATHRPGVYCSVEISDNLYQAQFPNDIRAAEILRAEMTS
jgi:hypothetical protein